MRCILTKMGGGGRSHAQSVKGLKPYREVRDTAYTLQLGPGRASITLNITAYSM